MHLLGRKAHGDLPAYCKGIDVGLIPYRIDERMKFVNPIKLREYLSAGLPVVSTAVPEVRRYERFCSIADGAPRSSTRSSERSRRTRPSERGNARRR